MKYKSVVVQQRGEPEVMAVVENELRRPVEGEVLVDYLRVPPKRPEHWPEILPNSARLSKVVYNGMQDVLRGVSRHVAIGRATKGGKPMSSWFVLCRED